jgi:subtilisin family serine protease
MGPLDLVNLTPLMERTSGRAQIKVAVIDGPVAVGHPDLSGARIHEVPGRFGATCARADSTACRHGTFVAGILSAHRASSAPAICPNCTLLVHPIFPETASINGGMPSATPEELAAAIVAIVDAGAHVVNISAALTQPSHKGEGALEQALDYAAHRGVLAVAAAGNQGSVGSSVVTRHPWVIAVAGCNLQGRPTRESNLGSSIGRRGLSAPGENITSLGIDGKPQSLGGTSVATPFVTGTIALLLSEFPDVNATMVKWAITQAGSTPRKTLVPPLLDAWASYQMMATARTRR